MISLRRASALTLAMTTLAACGGGGGGGGDGANPIPEYIAFTNASFAADSELEGRLLITGAGAAEIRALTGTLTHNTRALTALTDGGANSLTDADGDDSGTWTDGTITFQPDSNQTGTYGFAALYRLNADADGGSVVIGVTLDSADIPVANTTTGGVVYTGEALIDGSTDAGGAGTSLSGSGNSRVTVDFETETVDLVIDSIGGGVPYTSIEITGMAFSGDRTAFEGGTLTIMDGADNVTGTLIGGLVASSAEGDFYGIDGNANPDEVGGVFFGEGNTGEIYGGFLAD